MAHDSIIMYVCILMNDVKRFRWVWINKQPGMYMYHNIHTGMNYRFLSDFVIISLYSDKKDQICRLLDLTQTHYIYIHIYLIH